MYKIKKYIQESIRVIFYIAGIVILLASLMLIISNSLDLFKKPTTTQAVVISKYITDRGTFDIFQKGTTVYDKNYQIVVKTENGKVEKLKVTEMEYDLINENQQYVLRLQGSKVLFVLTSTQDTFLKSSNISKVEVVINAGDIEQANAYKANNSSINTKINTPTTSNTEKNVPSPTDTNIDNSSNNGNQNTENSPTPQPVNNSDMVNDQYKARQQIALANQQGKVNIAIESNLTTPYTSTIKLSDQKEYECSSIPSKYGSCKNENNKIVWNLTGLKANERFNLLIYSKDVADVSNFTVTVGK